MDISNLLLKARESLMTLTGLNEQQVSAGQIKLENMIAQTGMSQNMIVLSLLTVAGLLTLILLISFLSRSSSHSESHSNDHLEERIGSLEQMMHDLKTQLSMVKGQVKADFGFVKQEVEDLKVAISSRGTGSYSEIEKDRMVGNIR